MSAASSPSKGEGAARQVNIDLGAPLVECTMQLSVSRLNEAMRVIIASLNSHEQQLHNVLHRVGDMEKRQELMQRELNRIAPAAGASSAELLEQILQLKQDLAGLEEKTANEAKELSQSLGDRLTTAEEGVRNNAEQRTRDLITREKDFTQLTADMQKLSTRLGNLVIPDINPLENAQKSLTKRMDEAEKLLVFASSFAAVWDADTARVEAFQRAPTSEKVDYVHSLPPMKMLRNQLLTELRTQAVERLEMLTHELRDKVDLHKLTDLLGAVDEQLNELRVEDGRQERRLVSLEQGPLRISSMEDTLRRLQQSKADVSSLDLKADLAALQGLVGSINTVQDDINDLYDRLPRGGGGGSGSPAKDRNSASGRDRSSGSSSFRPSHGSAVPSLPAIPQAAGGGGGGAGATKVVDNAAVNALERRVAEQELQSKRLDDVKANRSELLRLHEYLDSKLQNFSALTSSAVAQANAAAHAASKTLAAASRNDAQQSADDAGAKHRHQQPGGNNDVNNSGDQQQQQYTPPVSGSPRGANNHYSNERSGELPVSHQARGTPSGLAHQPRPPPPQGGPGSSTRRISPNSRMQQQQQQQVGGLNQSIFAGPGSPGMVNRPNQDLTVGGSSALADDSMAPAGPTTISPTRRSPLPTARIGNSWHIGRTSVTVRDSSGHLAASASLSPKLKDQDPVIPFHDVPHERRPSQEALHSHHHHHLQHDDGETGDAQQAAAVAQ